jgi:SAM-dependent methyltransferase
MQNLIRFMLNHIPRPWLIRISGFTTGFLALFFRGNQVACPVCMKQFRKFLPYGYGPVRDNVLCPGCLSLERHRLLWLYLSRCTQIFKDSQKVLHLAPEQCFYKKFRKMLNLNYVTADLQSPLADIKLDIQDMPLGNDAFDVVICNHVLEHVPDDHKALAEIYRVLKPGGYAIMQVPADMTMEKTLEDPTVTDPAERARLFRQKDHYRLYGADFADRAKVAGFSVKEENFLFQLSQFERERYRLPEGESVVRYFK